MDSGLKERLVGAAVLIALGVWLIPWILDGRNASQPADDNSAAAVELPAADSPARTQTRTIALNEPPQSSSVNVAAPDRDATPTTQAPPIELPVPAAASGKSAGPGKSRAADHRVEPETAVEPAKAAAPERDVPVAAPSASPAAQDETRAAAVADGWYVQLGSFSDEGNARRLAGRVATFGYEADVSTYRAGGRALNRVRVGPSATREAAEAVASSLAAHGFVAQVVSAD